MSIIREEETMIIRPEQTIDFPEIYDLVKSAFETAKVKDGDGKTM